MVKRILYKCEWIQKYLDVTQVCEDSWIINCTFPCLYLYLYYKWIKSCCKRSAVHYCARGKIAKVKWYLHIKFCWARIWYFFFRFCIFLFVFVSFCRLFWQVQKSNEIYIILLVACIMHSQCILKYFQFKEIRFCQKARRKDK